MSEYKLGAVESKFADIIWFNEPLSSGEPVKLCEKELNWKRTITYTVLKKLCERGIFKNDGGTVFGLISRDDFMRQKARNLLRMPLTALCPHLLPPSRQRMH